MGAHKTMRVMVWVMYMNLTNIYLGYRHIPCVLSWWCLTFPTFVGYVSSSINYFRHGEIIFHHQRDNLIILMLWNRFFQPRHQSDQYITPCPKYLILLLVFWPALASCSLSTCCIFRPALGCCSLIHFISNHDRLMYVYDGYPHRQLTLTTFWN